METKGPNNSGVILRGVYVFTPLFSNKQIRQLSPYCDFENLFSLSSPLAHSLPQRGSRMLSNSRPNYENYLKDLGAYSNPSILETEDGRLLQIPGQPGRHSKFKFSLGNSETLSNLLSISQAKSLCFVVKTMEQEEVITRV